MTDRHPITPPPELIEEWIEQFKGDHPRSIYIATRAAQWGADQELEACCEWLENQPQWMEDLRAARRPKPPSLKRLALAALNEIEDRHAGPTIQEKLIRRALEQLDD